MGSQCHRRTHSDRNTSTSYSTHHSMAGLPVVGSLQKWFTKKDNVVIDNLLFRVHHQLSFFVLMVGLTFIFVENYFDGKAIQCTDADDFKTKHCWLHGTGRIKSDDFDVSQCSVFQDDEDVTKLKFTYYLWLPYLMLACLGLAKMSRTVWKNIEGGFMARLVKDKDEAPEKVGRSFLKNHKDRDFFLYHLKYTFCEMLNIVAVVASFYLCNSFLRGKFESYGRDVIYYKNKDEDFIRNEKMSDPQCALFPTVVSCDVSLVGMGGGTDKYSGACLLANNVFNQHYFLFLWFYWIVLLVISSLKLVFRLATITIPAFSKMMFRARFGSTKLSPGQYFALEMMARNMDMLTMKQVLKVIEEEKNTMSTTNDEKDSLLGQTVLPLGP